MLSKSWKIVLLVVALAAMIWPDLIGTATWWVSLIAVTVLLIEEILCSGHVCGETMMQNNSKLRKSSKKRRR